MLSVPTLKNLHFPLSTSQQLAELRYLQGRYEISQPHCSADLLAGMAVKSRLMAIKTMDPPTAGRAQYNYQNGLDFLSPPDQQAYTGSACNPAIQPLTADYIQQLHHQLNPQGGQWRKVKLNVTRRDQPDAKLLIPAAHATAIDQCLQQLQQALDADIEPLVIIPLFMLQLMQLFPFLDGNRRIVLLLARQLLAGSSYTLVHYVDLESEFSATERMFYRALYQASHGATGPIPWLGYWWVLIKRLYQRFDRQIQHTNISPGRGSKTALVQRFVAQQQQPFRFSDVCQALPTISPAMVRTALRGLQDKHLIRSEGKGRGALWININSG